MNIKVSIAIYARSYILCKNKKKLKKFCRNQIRDSEIDRET